MLFPRGSEVKKVDHCYLSVDAMSQPMTISEGDSPPYGRIT